MADGELENINYNEFPEMIPINGMGNRSRSELKFN